MKAAKGTGASGGSGAKAQGRAHLEQSLAEIAVEAAEDGGLGGCHSSLWDEEQGRGLPQGPTRLGLGSREPGLRFGDLFNPEGKKHEMHAGRRAAPPGTLVGRAL